MHFCMVCSMKQGVKGSYAWFSCIKLHFCIVFFVIARRRGVRVGVEGRGQEGKVGVGVEGRGQEAKSGSESRGRGVEGWEMGSEVGSWARSQDSGVGLGGEVFGEDF